MSLPATVASQLIRDLSARVDDAEVASDVDLFRMATAAAALGAEDDAIEFFARYLAVARGVDLGETPAIDFVRASPGTLETAIGAHPPLERALARVAARHDGSIPSEHQLVTQIALPAPALAALLDLVDQPPVPTEALRRLLDEPRA